MGHYALSTIYSCGKQGSSRQVWGTLAYDVTYLSDRGLIPTGAGNTIRRPRGYALSRAHPHRRGEHLVYLQLPLVLLGSSPQGWGTRPDKPRKLLQRGLISTGVGNTLPDQQQYHSLYSFYITLTVFGTRGLLTELLEWNKTYFWIITMIIRMDITQDIITNFW